MTQTDFLSEPRSLAYDQTLGAGPGVVFLSGFNSSKDGTKALHLEGWAKSQGRAFLRFDYSGHGASAGRFDDGTIGRWTEDAAAIIDGLTKGPQVIVGSSMGGWIACLLARDIPERFAGLVTIAAAPDFTEENYWAHFTAAERKALRRDGHVMVQSPYDETPYKITRTLIEEARTHLILQKPLHFPFPTRILHGSADKAVPVSMGYRLFDHATGDDMRLTVVKGADHRFSSRECLDLIKWTIDEIAPLKR